VEGAERIQFRNPRDTETSDTAFRAQWAAAAPRYLEVLRVASGEVKLALINSETPRHHVRQAALKVSEYASELKAFHDNCDIVLNRN